MVTVSISETYDLHTVVNKMTLIGIHTPKKELIQKMYPGLCMNYKYFRIKSVDVALSTAQQLPLGVDQIGLDTGQIRPQDMMNPILYKACSNDSWSTLEYRIHGLINQGEVSPSSSYVAPPVSGHMADVENDGGTGIADEHGVYYALLSNRDGFRVAHPQSGLRMKGLRPIVFQKLYSDAINETKEHVDNDTVNDYVEGAGSLEGMRMVSFVNGSSVMRGRAVPMPRMNTTYLTGIYPGTSYPGSVTTPVRGQNFQANGMDAGTPANFHIQMPDIPPVMLGAIILPPVTATTGILYYRMVCRSYIEFTDVRPMTDLTSFNEMNNISSTVYHSDYSEQSKTMDKTTDMVDIKNGDIEKIMEGR